MSATLRKQAIARIASRNAGHSLTPPNRSITEIYGEDVFNFGTMKDYLPKAVFKTLLATTEEGQILDAGVADEVANAMKRWAISKGATHYTHWFQPLTGSTAEKHDSFVEPDAMGSVIMNFSGKNLIMGEPDASSFPSGGLRATFEARGYTAWDPTSPAFIKRNDNGATLCIPTAFCSYTGEALDKKTPLLRSIQAISKQTRRVLACFGEKSSVKVSTSLGAEQEYFLIDKELYVSRPDLLQTGRTLFGNVPSKHQQMDDHYFGAIKTRVLNFMTDVDNKLWRLGIPAKTRHNEVSPAQFEIAPVFEELNLSIDHNMQTMEVLRQTADKHGLVCLMHEKPFAGVNGSGKHNNWSLGTSSCNLLNPGDNPHENAMFLTFLCAVIKAVDTHADLLRAVVASAGNDHRLGANEAPPAIISIFLGEQLAGVIEQLEKGGASTSKQGGSMHIGADSLPVLPRDATDRNRTSPFAFTGNKFEFRAVGSNQSCSGPNIVLNTIVAEALDEIATALEKIEKPEKFNDELQKLLQGIIAKHKRVIFNGDNYSDAWVKEAERRGLPNLKKTPEALECIKSAKAVRLFEKYKVLSEGELHSRYEIYKEAYDMTIAIEGGVALDIAKNQILPAATAQLKASSDALINLIDIEIEAGTKALTGKVETIGGLIDDLAARCAEMEAALDADDIAAIAALLESVREPADKLEKEVDDNQWPLPKYQELLFIY